MTVPVHAARDLVQLKALLDQALAAAGSGAPLQRLTAVVLLDAVNERALHVAAPAADVAPGERDSMDKVAGALEAALGERWARQGWPDVRRLHRVRNLAQHEGLPAAAELLPDWAAATSLFARTLVRAAYNVDLDEITLADAVNDQEAADLLRTAEKRLTEGDPGAAVAAASAAFDRARAKWLASRPGRTPFGPFGAFTRHDDPLRDVKQHLQGLADASAVAAFAADPAEHIWFRGLLADSRTPPTPAEAQRAVAFVFWWIVRWEAFASSYVPDRHTARLRALRQTRTAATDAIAAVAAAELAPGWRDGYDEARLLLAQVPADDTFPAWADAVAARVSTATGERAYIEEDGTLVVPIPHAANPAALIQTAQHALIAAETDVAQAQQDATARAEQAAADDADYRACAAEHRYPDWLLDTGLGSSDITQPHTPCLVVRLDTAFAAGTLHAAIRDHPAVSACYTAAHDQTVITPALKPGELAQVLQDVDAALRPDHDQRNADRAAADQALRTRTAALQAAVANAAADTARP